jgi:response regulator RpfG family c-di-GMP phosphodiesterase
MSDPSTGCRILVVDDEANLCEAIARRLIRAGHEVITAPDADTALAHCEPGKRPFDLVITDVHMPGMNGLDLATALIERRPAQRVIIMTGIPDEAMRRAALARGPVSFLPKPFDGELLLTAVNEALAVHRQTLTPPPVAQGGSGEAAMGTVAPEWLVWADERSTGDPGHADRVARMARVIAAGMQPEFSDLGELEVAAWSHEIGLLAGPTANPVDMAWRSAEILKECGSSERVITMVRYMFEEWDGSGGPEQRSGESIPRGAQILSAADSLDHYCAGHLRSGKTPEDAATRAVELVMSQSGSLFDPQIADVVRAHGDALRTICGVTRRERVRDLSQRPKPDIPLDLQTTLEEIGS